MLASTFRKDLVMKLKSSSSPTIIEIKTRSNNVFRLSVIIVILQILVLSLARADDSADIFNQALNESFSDQRVSETKTLQIENTSRIRRDKVIPRKSRIEVDPAETHGVEAGSLVLSD